MENHFENVRSSEKPAANNSALSTECWTAQVAHTPTAANAATRENEMFGSGDFTFAGSGDIYKATPAERKIVEQMRAVMHNVGIDGDGYRGTVYSGAVGTSLNGQLQESNVYSHAVDKNNTQTPAFAYEMKDLVLKGAMPSDTWHSNPSIDGKAPNLFSKEDIEQANVYGTKAYVLKPSGEVIKYTGDRGHAFQESDRLGQKFGLLKEDGNFIVYPQKK
jgi:hypothetical protein